MYAYVVCNEITALSFKIECLLYDGCINLLFYTHIHTKLIIAEEYSDDCCFRVVFC